jgi:hypothetical protein
VLRLDAKQATDDLARLVTHDDIACTKALVMNSPEPGLVVMLEAIESFDDELPAARVQRVEACLSG